MREGRLQRDGVSLHWREWEPAEPAREPALFCLHGLSSNSMYWARLAARFPHRRVVALDQRAHGSSDRPETGYGFEDLVADAEFAMRELDLGRPVLLGHSWGAAVALALAARVQDDLAALVHVDGPLLSFGRLMSWEQASQLMQPPLKRFASLEDAVAEQREYLKHGWGDDLVAFVAAGLIRDAEAYVLPMDAAVRLQILRELYDLKPEELWPQLRLPVLVMVAGGAPEFIVPWKKAGAEAVAELLPAAEIRWYRSEHDIPLHLPDETAADVEELAGKVN